MNINNQSKPSVSTEGYKDSLAGAESKDSPKTMDTLTFAKPASNNGFAKLPANPGSLSEMLEATMQRLRGLMPKAEAEEITETGASYAESLVAQGLTSSNMTQSSSFSVELDPSDRNSNETVASFVNGILRPTSNSSAFEVPNNNTRTDAITIGTGTIFEGDDVFKFNLKPEDDDRPREGGTNADRTRQRAEIDVDFNSPEEHKAKLGETFRYDFEFGIPSDFAIEEDFAHFFQLKTANNLDFNDTSAPLLTLSVVKFDADGNPDKENGVPHLVVGHREDNHLREDENGKKTEDNVLQTLARVPLSEVVGKKLGASIEVVADNSPENGGNGSVDVKVWDLDQSSTPTADSLFLDVDQPVDLWREESNREDASARPNFKRDENLRGDEEPFLRPKIGLYRGIATKETDQDGNRIEVFDDRTVETTIEFRKFSINKLSNEESLTSSINTAIRAVNLELNRDPIKDDQLRDSTNELRGLVNSVDDDDNVSDGTLSRARQALNSANTALN